MEQLRVGRVEGDVGGARGLDDGVAWKVISACVLLTFPQTVSTSHPHGSEQLRSAPGNTDVTIACAGAFQPAARMESRRGVASSLGERPAFSTIAPAKIPSIHKRGMDSGCPLPGDRVASAPSHPLSQRGAGLARRPGDFDFGLQPKLSHPDQVEAKHTVLPTPAHT